MSVHAINWAWKQDVGNPTRKLVLVALADHANSDGECWPAMKTIAELAECDPRTVQRHVAALEEQGLVERSERRQREDGKFTSWHYVLHMSTGHSRPEDSDDHRTLTSGGPADTSVVVQRTPVSGQEPSVEPSVDEDEPDTTQRLVDLLAEHVHGITGKKPRTTGWQEEVVGLITADHAPPDLIEQVIVWLDHDDADWWRNNQPIVNVKKLRKHFDMLAGQMRASQRRKEGSRDTAGLGLRFD